MLEVWATMAKMQNRNLRKRMRLRAFIMYHENCWYNFTKRKWVLYDIIIERDGTVRKNA